LKFVVRLGNADTLVDLTILRKIRTSLLVKFHAELVRRSGGGRTVPAGKGTTVRKNLPCRRIGKSKSIWLYDKRG
jgi:hypothetical protein